MISQGFLGNLGWISCTPPSYVRAYATALFCFPLRTPRRHEKAEEFERRRASHGERSRLQLLFKLGGTENMSILAVNVLAVNRPLPPLYSVKKCIIHSI